jgi:hypothetical protein
MQPLRADKDKDCDWLEETKATKRSISFDFNIN